MARRYCSICIKEIGTFAYHKDYPDGKTVCRECARKAGILDSSLQDEVPFETVKAWYYDPNKRDTYIKAKEKKEEEAKRAELERQQEEERKRKEEQEKAEAEAKEREKKLFPDGRVHVAIRQVSFTNFGAAVGSGNALDSYIQNLQDQGCRIMDVTCYASGPDTKYVQAVVVYRTPPAE